LSSARSETAFRKPAIRKLKLLQPLHLLDLQLAKLLPPSIEGHFADPIWQSPPPCSGLARPLRRLVSAWRQSLQACNASSVRSSNDLLHVVPLQRGRIIHAYPLPVQHFGLNTHPSAANSVGKLLPHPISEPLHERLAVFFPCRKVDVSPRRNKKPAK
jgi:hypothetical protein